MNFVHVILRAQGMEFLIKIVMDSTNKNTIKHGTWAISNLCRGRPLPKFELTKNAIPVLCKVIIEETDTEPLTDATWALSYLSGNNIGNIFFFIIFKQIMIFYLSFLSKI